MHVFLASFICDWGILSAKCFMHPLLFAYWCWQSFTNNFFSLCPCLHYVFYVLYLSFAILVLGPGITEKFWVCSAFLKKIASFHNLLFLCQKSIFPGLRKSWFTPHFFVLPAKHHILGFWCQQFPHISNFNLRFLILISHEHFTLCPSPPPHFWQLGLFWDS